MSMTITETNREPIDANQVVGSRHIALITLDSLRYDTARDALAAGLTPNLAKLLPADGWEHRHAPGTFTFASHQAVFAGFFPTPAHSGAGVPRLFACRPPDGRTTRPTTFVFDDDNIVTGLARHGYRTVCIGGVDFFASGTPLGSVFPAKFAESYWRPEFGPTRPDSTGHQVDQALTVLRQHAGRPEPLFLFLNVSANHVPHHHYRPEARGVDCRESQIAALAYTDAELGRLLGALADAGQWLVVICADHGDAYGDDGYHGHGNAHPSVTSVPYAEMLVG
ncbi:STM4013/SEN3800 family hydrolase [Streptomyces goshikiensis]|uniref:STM4013/SEN3800 family hydrolase n=1 Tax=Streptomyces goshikiensis TaxID=1942 RepID=UPI0036D1AA44